MSQSEPADLLSRLYNELAQRIVEQCTQEFLAPVYLTTEPSRAFVDLYRNSRTTSYWCRANRGTRATSLTRWTND